MRRCATGYVTTTTTPKNNQFWVQKTTLSKKKLKTNFDSQKTRFQLYTAHRVSEPRVRETEPRTRPGSARFGSLTYPFAALDISIAATSLELIIGIRIAVALLAAQCGRTGVFL